MKPSILFLSVFFWVIATAAIAQNQQIDKTQLNDAEWAGWRGCEKQGKITYSNIPENWSIVNNLVWKTEIPGRGNSSPIIYKNNVYLTTAYESTKWMQKKKVIIYFIYFLMFLVTFYVILILMNNKIKTIGDFFKFLLMISCWSLLLIFILFGRHILHYTDNLDARSWFSSGLVLLLCSVLSLSVRIEKKWFHILIGFILLMFSTFHILSAPPPANLYIAKMIFHPSIQSFVYLSAPLIIVLIGAIQIVVGLVAYTKLNHKLEKVVNCFSREIKKKYIYFTLFFILFIVLLAIGYILTSDLLRFYFVENIKFKSDLHWTYIVMFVFLCTIWISMIFIFKNRKKQITLPPVIFSILVLFFGLILFTNLVVINNKSLITHSLVSVNKFDGRINWICETTDYPLGLVSSFNSSATPTPVTDGKHIFAYFGSAGLFCVNTEGEIIWKNTDLKYENVYGVAVSPILYDQILIIAADLPSSPYIAAINCSNGKEIWKRDRIDDGFGYNGLSRTPVILPIQNKKAVIVWGRSELTLYDLYTGEVLNAYKNLPTSLGDAALSIVYDNNLNLFLSAPNIAYTLNIKELNPKINPLIWSTNLQDGPNCSTPVLVNGLFFMVSEKGTLTCLDSISGKILWTKKLKGNYFSSPIGLGNSIIFCNHQGLITVISAKSSFEKIMETDLAETTMASIALSFDQLFIRTEHHLFCFMQQQNHKISKN
jgi:outer membrane protein assembly factor BamB